MKILLAIVMILPSQSIACGWWGDGEMNRELGLPRSKSGTRHLPQRLDSDSMRLPHNLGYGIAIAEPGQLLPYLQLTYGREIGGLEDLAAFGFNSIIEVERSDERAPRSTRQDLSRRLSVYRISIDSPFPDQPQITTFHQLLMNPNNLPALVSAPSADVLASLWSTYRLEIGAPLAYVLNEAISLGLPLEHATILRQR